MSSRGPSEVPLEIYNSVNAEQILLRRQGPFPLLHVPVKRQEVPAHGGGESPEPALMLGMSPPRVVEGRRRVKVESGSGAHDPASPQPVGTEAREAMRS